MTEATKDSEFVDFAVTARKYKTLLTKKFINRKFIFLKNFYKNTILKKIKKLKDKLNTANALCATI